MYTILVLERHTQPKVDKPNLHGLVKAVTVLADRDILWLDVTVNEATTMHYLELADKLNSYLEPSTLPGNFLGLEVLQAGPKLGHHNVVPGLVFGKALDLEQVVRDHHLAVFYNPIKQLMVGKPPLEKLGLNL